MRLLEAKSGNWNLLDYTQAIDRITQITHPFENMSITLRKVTNCPNPMNLDLGTILQVENDCSFTNIYVLENWEAKEALKDTTAHLRNDAIGWADNTDEPFLQRLCWRIDLPSEVAASPDYDGEFAIICERFFYNYHPIEWVKDEADVVLSWDKYEDAEEYINQMNEGIYCLSHNEVSRPQYTIVRY